ncbi:MAG: Hsp70 family protein [Chloroflexota bacterium]|nr:Hsp70 family protein [Chloroflexota bacterium]
MAYKLAIDFGTTNTVVARWDDTISAPEVLALPTIGVPARANTNQNEGDLPPVVPSLLYVNDAKKSIITVGQVVRDKGYDMEKSNRLFRNFKRGIVSSPSPDPRKIDNVEWDDSTAGRAFVKRVIDTLPHSLDDIEQLVLCAPVASFEGYLAWLNNLFTDSMQDKIRVVDESTAAALGYAVTEPGAIVLVFDFGGGTLDLSLVELPESREKTGGFLGRLRRGNPNQHTARVIAKAGRVIGGSDVDQWMVADVLKRTGVTIKQLGNHYAALLTACEQAKISLSTVETSEITFQADRKTHTLPYTRAELEALLEENGFYNALRRVVDKVMYVARQRGIYKEDVHYVLLVGGTSLMPSVRQTLQTYFTNMAVRSDKPFTAVAEGALQEAAGFGLEDYLVHSYGLRYLDPETGEHAWDEIIPMGSRYPTETTIDIALAAAHANQREIEFVIGEIDTDAVSMIEVQYEDGQAVFVAQAGSGTQQIIPVNESAAASLLARLNPSGKPGDERLRAEFRVDARRQLRMTVIDVQTNKSLLDDVVLATLR